MSADYALPDDRLLAACEEHRSRASGPGGQHANRTESGVRLVHRTSGIEARCADHREQAANRRAALRVLRLRLALAERGGSDPAWLRPHVRGGRCALGPNAQDWPLIAACALDALDRAQGSLAEAAAALALSTTQLARLLTRDGELRAAADRLRAAHGLGALHG